MSASLRIAWLSPFSDRSDVSAFSRCLLPHFGDESCGSAAECHLFANENGAIYRSSLPTMKLHHDVSAAEILATYDAAVFNMGNNVENHGAILQALRGMPGIAILHDFSYQHLFAHLCFEQVNSPAAYVRLMHEWYGSAGFGVAIRSGVATHGSRLYAPWDSDHIADFPLLEPVAGLAAAVVVHSTFMEKRVRKNFDGPILRLFLPSDQKTAPAAEALARWRDETARRKHCQFVTFGWLARSKCLDLIISAFAQSSLLKSSARLLIAGRPGDRGHVQELENLVVNLGLQNQVSFEYSVTDERLLTIKEDADVFLNLRHPNTEGASGSLIEMLNAGKPVIAYRSGCYADVPDEAVILIDQSGGSQTLVDAMESISKNAGRRIKIGKAAQHFVHAEDSRQYVRTLKEFISANRSDLKRRAQFVAPIRDGRSAHQAQVVDTDTGWLESLARSRSTFTFLERDSAVQAPGSFLTWPTADIVTFAGRVLLNVPKQADLVSDMAAVLGRVGRWPFYQLICRLRALHTLCEKGDIRTENATAYIGRIPDVDFWTLARHLRAETLAKIHYLGVLGRRWGEGEPDGWARKLEQGAPVHGVTLDFLGSPEYRKFFSDELMQGVEDWAMDGLAAAYFPSVRRAPAPVWYPGHSIRFGEPDSDRQPFLTEGWHPREEAGRWSNGRMAKLRFRLPDEMSDDMVALELRVRVSGTAFTGTRKVAAYANGKKLGILRLNNDGPETWTLPLGEAASLSPNFDVVLVTKQSFSPAAMGVSADSRELGLLLSEARLLSADALKVGEILPLEKAEVLAAEDDTVDIGKVAGHASL